MKNQLMRLLVTCIAAGLVTAAYAQNDSDEFQDLFDFELDEGTTTDTIETDEAFPDFFKEDALNENTPVSENQAAPAVKQSAGEAPVVIKMLEKREIPKQLIIRMTMASPTYVSQDLLTWDSNVDFRVGIELPIIMMGLVPGVDVSSFKFVNALPAEGTYSGVAVYGTLSRPMFPGKFTTGAGLVGAAFGGFVQQAYDFTIGGRLVISADFRLTYTTDMDGKGFNSWFDLGFSPGVILVK